MDVSHKKDSFEICFIPDNEHGKFIERKTEGRVKEGNFVDENGNILGKHKGIAYYTIGQRKGLGLSLGKPGFVVGINVDKNEVVIGEQSKIFNDTLIAKDLNFIPFDELKEEKRVTAKIRYAASEEPATLIPMEDGTVKVVFDNMVRAITTGQSVVFYDGDIVVGGGVIDKVI